MSAAWAFGFFFVSGLCSLVYEVVWLRLAMASFGVTTPLVSIVLSVFMAGLALGSWGAGRVTTRSMPGGARTFLRLYAAAELVIAVSGVLVPFALRWGRSVLSAESLGGAWDSWSYYAASGMWVTATLLPACAAMGATFPLAMAAMQRARGADASAFSFLYMANILGATVGTLLSAFVMIELLGFRRTALLTCALNVMLAVIAVLLSRRSIAGAAPAVHAPSIVMPPPRPRLALVALFLTGLLSLGFEVIWIRQLSPYLGTVVYAFAAVLAVYLAAGFCGSRAYRSWLRGSSSAAMWGWTVAACAALVPLVAADFRLAIPAAPRAVLAIAPFCAVVGYLTPMLIDRWTAGDPARAGLAYAMNVLGSIAGPLVVGFWLLPMLGERGALIVLTSPLIALAALAAAKPSLVGGGEQASRSGRAIAVALALVSVMIVVSMATKGFDVRIRGAQVRRDHTATVIAGEYNGQKVLLVNGQPTTVLTPLTKMMAHLPLAMLPTPPRDALVICFGMGTTFRSVLTWGIDATVVELVPSVPSLVGVFHPNAAGVLTSPRAHIVIDDGRRFLERSAHTWDVITLDPPYPVEMAGSGLLYAKEFYAVARRRLRPGGVLQQWLPETEPAIVAAAAKALMESFPYVRVFVPLRAQGHMVGIFFLAGLTPITERSPAVLASRLPAAAAADLLEWMPGSTPEEHFHFVLSHEVPTANVVALAPRVPAMQDDRPVNEYYFVRRWLSADGVK